MEIDGKEHKVRDLMRPPVILDESVELQDALKTLVDTKSNIACVVNEDGILVGGVSTLDVIRAILPDYIEADTVAARFADDRMLKEDALKAAKKQLSEFVNSDEATVDPDANLLEATAISSIECNGRIIVVDAENKPVGLLTRTEIKQVLAAFLGISNELHKVCKDRVC